MKHTSSVVVVVASSIAVFAFLFPDHWIVQRLNATSTILLALLTGAYVFFTYKILNSTRPQPHVYVSLPSEEIDIFLSIRNIGQRPAYDVQITIDPSLDIIAPTDQFKGASAPMLRQPFLPPEDEVRNFISTSLQVLSMKGGTTKFKIGIKYRDYYFRWYSDSYEIDLATYVFEKRFQIFNDTHYLREISKTLDSMNKKIEQLRQPPAPNSEKQ